MPLSGPLLAQGSFSPRGPVAAAMADLWWLMLALGTVVFLVFMAYLVVGARRGEPKDDGAVLAEADSPPLLRSLLVLGVIGPALILVVVFGATLRSMRQIPDEITDGTLVIEATAHQWWWEFRYPDRDVVTANELHVPVGQEFAIRMTSADVIHSFWIPELGGKIDALPDGETTLVLQADQPGRYEGRCAEFCGLQHTKMGVVLIAESEDEYRAWLDGQAQPAAEPTTQLARQGLSSFLDSRCVECHTIRGTPADGTGGPDLTHVASRIGLAANTVPNTSERLEAWITDPHSIKQGVDMPAFSRGQAELEAVLAFLEGLR